MLFVHKTYDCRDAVTRYHFVHAGKILLRLCGKLAMINYEVINYYYSSVLLGLDFTVHCLLHTLGLFGYFFAVVRPPLFWPWEGSNYHSRSCNGPNWPKGPKFTQNKKHIRIQLPYTWRVREAWKNDNLECFLWSSITCDLIIWLVLKLTHS